ncbi:hypothetical protein Tco_1505953 [Tanacetum coccineum]
MRRWEISPREMSAREKEKEEFETVNHLCRDRHEDSTGDSDKFNGVRHVANEKVRGDFIWARSPLIASEKSMKFWVVTEKDIIEWVSEGDVRRKGELNVSSKDVVYR